MNGKKCGWAKVSWLLIFIGGLNWGLVGLSYLIKARSSWNLVEWIFGSWPIVVAIIYLLVGIAAVMSLFGCKCGVCKSSGNGNDQMGGQP